MAENTGNIGFEETLWKAADKLRGSMDASEYKYVVLGLIFLKYISDKFESKFNELLEEGAGFEEDRDEYLAENIFWVPKEARWSFVMDNAKDPKIGQFIDDAMILIEKENPSLKGVLDKRYARPELDKRRLGELIDLISTIKLHNNGEKDLLGRVYEYFIGQFASVEGKGGGEFYTPTSIVKTLVEMIEPYEGRVYDVRNTLVHYTPEDYSIHSPFLSENHDQYELTEFLDGKFEYSTFYKKSGNPFFPDKCLGYGFSKWALINAVSFVDDFHNSVGLKPIYDHVRKDIEF